MLNCGGFTVRNVKIDKVLWTNLCSSHFSVSDKTTSIQYTFTMTIQQLPEFTLTIPPEWIDRNGHVNVAYYVLAFDYATDAFYDKLGIGEAYQGEGFSLFTLGLNVNYLREIFEGTAVKITTQLINWDHKRLHYFHRMINVDAGYMAATNECIAMNVNLTSRRSAPFNDNAKTEIEKMMAAHSQMNKPHGLVKKL